MTFKSRLANSYHTQEYSAHDMVLATQLIMQEKGITHKMLGDAVSLAKNTVFNKMHQSVTRIKHKSPLPAHDTEYRYVALFTISEQHDIARYLGKQCGHETGFLSVPAMIQYAQTHYTLEAPQEWVRQNYRSQEREAEIAENLPHLKQFKAAVDMLIKQKHYVAKKLACTPTDDGPKLDSALYSYLINANPNLTDKTKYEKLETVAPLLGSMMGQKDWTLASVYDYVKTNYKYIFNDPGITNSPAQSRGRC